MKTLTKSNFLSWLQSRPRNSRIGQPDETGNCPLCQFLRAQGARHICITYDNRIIGGRSTPNAKWMTKFQRRAVALQKMLGLHSITAKSGLNIMESLDTDINFRL